jgi:hypothetical protein
MEIFKILNHEYITPLYKKLEFQEKNIYEKIKFTFNNYNKIYYISHYYKYKYKKLQEIYEKPYHTFFCFDLCKFLNNVYKTIYITEEGKYPIMRVYKFYP